MKISIHPDPNQRLLCHYLCHDTSHKNLSWFADWVIEFGNINTNSRVNGENPRYDVWPFLVWIISSQSSISFSMAVASSLFLHYQIFGFSNPNSHQFTFRRSRTKWVSTFSITHKRVGFSFITNCSPSQTPSPETSTQTAESCVNVGLALFNKGRVCLLPFLFLPICLIALN